MGTIIIQKETTVDPISLIGREAGVCWGADINDDIKNSKRGMDCLKANHGRTLEYPQVFMILDGYSARVIRELYTHIGGGPTRLQASTRYIDYESGFTFVTPPSVSANKDAEEAYTMTMDEILAGLKRLESLGIPREDIAMLLPLGMATKVVLRTNLRNLIDMSHQRLCARAYWEFRALMRDMMNALKAYGEENNNDEWSYIVDEMFKPKCALYGYCPEKTGCGAFPKK